MSMTWSKPGEYSAQAVCSTADESASLPVDGDSSGIDLTGLESFSAQYETTSGNITAGVTGAVYYQNPFSLKWSIVPALALSFIGGAPNEGTQAFEVPNRIGRLAVIPLAFGQPGILWLTGTRKV